MGKSMIRIEIFEGDPFSSGCCCSGIGSSSIESAEELRRMLTERDQIVKKISKEFTDRIQIKREIVSQKGHDYPEYVRRLLLDDKPLPYIFMDEKPVTIGKFPAYAEFSALLENVKH